MNVALQHIALDQIAGSGLQLPISGRANENARIKYKRQTYGTSSSDRKEFLAGITSFANLSEGDIVIGLDEAQGIPTELCPFTGDQDQEAIRLQQMARCGIEPRIQNLWIRAVPLTGGGQAIVVRIPRSIQRPAPRQLPRIEHNPASIVIQSIRTK